MNQKGQTMVEFALTAFIILAVLLAIIEFAVMFFVNLTMQHAVREGARYAITGQGGNNGAQRRKALEAKVIACSYGLYHKNRHPDKDLKVNVITPANVSPYSNYSGTPVKDTGEPGEIIAVTLNYSWPLLTPMLTPLFKDGRYDFVVRATMTHEPWEEK